MPFLGIVNKTRNGDVDRISGNEDILRHIQLPIVLRDGQLRPHNVVTYYQNFLDVFRTYRRLLATSFLLYTDGGRLNIEMLVTSTITFLLLPILRLLLRSKVFFVFFTTKKWSTVPYIVPGSTSCIVSGSESVLWNL